MLSLDISHSPPSFSSGLEAVLAAMIQKPFLQSLRMSRCGLCADILLSVLTGIQNPLSSVTCIDVSHNDICKAAVGDLYDPDPILALAVTIRHLPASSKLTEINFSYNALGPGVADGIAQALKNPQLHLRVVNLESCKLDHQAGMMIGQALSSITGLETLLLARNNLWCAGIKCILEGLVHNTSLSTVDLSYNRKNPPNDPPPIVRHTYTEFVVAFVMVLEGNLTLRHLSLEGNDLFGAAVNDIMSDEFAPTVLLALTNCTQVSALKGGKLEVLNVIGNQLCDRSCDDCKPLDFSSSYLCSSQTCTRACLKNTIRALRSHPNKLTLCGLTPTQESLRVRGDLFLDAFSPVLSDEIERHHKLKMVDLSNAHIGGKSIVEIARGLSFSGTVKKCRLGEAEKENHRNIIQAFKAKSYGQRCAAAVFTRGCCHLGAQPMRLISEYLWGSGPVASKYLEYILIYGRPSALHQLPSYPSAQPYPEICRGITLSTPN